MKTMVSLEEASRLMFEMRQEIGTENVCLMDALYRVLAQDILAGENVPSFNRSPFDGYAMRAADLASASPEQPVTLSVTEEVPAGHMPRLEVSPGQAAKIMTGAPVPAGADCVVKFEETREDGDSIIVSAQCKSGQNIIPIGEDIAKGTMIAPKGTVIDPALIGMMASLGMEDVPVYRQPNVAILSTGDEVVPVGAELTQGKTRNSNAYALAGALLAIGAKPVFLGIARDETEAIGAAVESGLRDADMIITTGGVSVGDYDLMQEALQKIGTRAIFWRIRIKPGGAVLAARKYGKMILCLSGSPAAAMLSFHLLASPYVCRMAGRSRWQNEEIDVALKSGINKPSFHKRFVRGRLAVEDGRSVMITAEKQGNGVLDSFIGAALLGMIPECSGPIPPGTRIKAYVTRAGNFEIGNGQLK